MTMFNNIIANFNKRGECMENNKNKKKNTTNKSKKSNSKNSNVVKMQSSFEYKKNQGFFSKFRFFI